MSIRRARKSARTADDMDMLGEAGFCGREGTFLNQENNRGKGKLSVWLFSFTNLKSGSFKVLYQLGGGGVPHPGHSEVLHWALSCTLGCY